MRSSWPAKLVIALEFMGIAGIVLIGGGLLLVRVARQANTSVPQVSLLSPSMGDVVEASETLDVHIVASDPDGIQRLELWVDGKILEVAASALPGGSTPLPLVTEWRPDAMGAHTLIVRAVDTQGTEGVAEVILQTVEGEPTAAFQVQQGESTLPPGTLAEIEEASPGLLDDLAEQGSGLVPALPDDEQEEGAPPPPPGTEEEPPTLAPGLAGRLPGMSRLLGGIRLSADPERLEVEAVSLETSEAWFEKLYCYIQLDELIERLPAEGYLQVTEGRLWDIAAYAGEANRRIIPVPDDASVDVYVQCLVNGNHLGEFRARHTSDEWDGRLLEQTAWNGPYWFKVAYRIQWAGGSGEGEFPAPHGLTYACREDLTLDSVVCTLSWGYPEEARGEISGYGVQRNGEIVYGIYDPSQTWLLLTEQDGVPPCGDTYEYRIVAFKGDLADPSAISTPSYPVFLRAQMCPRKVRVDFVHIYFASLAGDCHGDRTCRDMFGNDCAEDGYAKFWANDKIVRLCGHLDVGWVLCDFDCLETTYIWETLGTEAAGVVLPLAEAESLQIGFSVRDYDPHTGNDLECAGEVLVSPETISQVAASESKTRWIDVSSTRGGGSCQLSAMLTAPVSPFVPVEEGRDISGP